MHGSGRWYFQPLIPGNVLSNQNKYNKYYSSLDNETIIISAQSEICLIMCSALRHVQSSKAFSVVIIVCTRGHKWLKCGSITKDAQLLHLTTAPPSLLTSCSFWVCSCERHSSQILLFRSQKWRMTSVRYKKTRGPTRSLSWPKKYVTTQIWCVSRQQKHSNKHKKT